MSANDKVALNCFSEIDELLNVWPYSSCISNCRELIEFVVVHSIQGLSR